MISSSTTESAPAARTDSPCPWASDCLPSKSTKLPSAGRNAEMGDLLPQTNGYAQLAADVLARAKQCGATEADIVVADGETFSVQVRVGVVDRLSKAREKRLGLRVFVGKRSACTSTSDFSTESLHRLVSETCTLAKAVVEDQVSGLPEAARMAKDWP